MPDSQKKIKKKASGKHIEETLVISITVII